MIKKAIYADQYVRPLGAEKSWARSPGTLIAGQANIDGVDHLAHELESYWGHGRLRLLVSNELRERFDRQRYLFNQAVWHGDLEQLRQQCFRMAKAWTALDLAAKAAHCTPSDKNAWEVVLEDGTVAVIVPDSATAGTLVADGRQRTVYTLAEIGRILSAYPQISQVKAQFPGATVSAISEISDPLNAIVDSDLPLDDPIPVDAVPASQGKLPEMGE